MLSIRRSRARAKSAKSGAVVSSVESPTGEASRRAVVSSLGSSDGDRDWPIQVAAVDTEDRPKQRWKKKTQHQKQQAASGSDARQQQQQKKKQHPIVGFFKRIKLRPLWRRSRSRSRSRGRLRRRQSPGSPPDDDVIDGDDPWPGPLDLRLLPPPARSLLSATVLASLPLDPWGCPYDFAVQGDRLLVPGLDVAELSLAPGGGGGSAPRRQAVGLLRGYAPLCIDATPGLVYLTAAGLAGCGLFVFDRAGRLAASRLEAATVVGSRPRRPGMFAVRVNFRGECWVTNPRDLCVDHYTAALRRIRSIDVAQFGVPYYLTAHNSHRHACLWVSFPESRRVVKFDWLTLEPLCHLAFGADQSPCGLHLDELGQQLYVTDIAGGRLLVYHAASMGLAGASTRAANAAVAAANSERPAAIRLSGGRLLLLSCSAADRCRIDVFAVAFEEGDDGG